MLVDTPQVANVITEAENSTTAAVVDWLFFRYKTKKKTKVFG